MNNKKTIEEEIKEELKPNVKQVNEIITIIDFGYYKVKNNSYFIQKLSFYIENPSLLLKIFNIT